MNPAALKNNIADLKAGGVLIANTGNFSDKFITKAGYEADPLDDPTLEEQFTVVKVDLNKAAVNGYPLEEVGHRLKAAWTGEAESLRYFDQAQTCIEVFRTHCLQHNLVDISLAIDLFHRFLRPGDACEAYLSQFTYLAVEGVEESVPVAQDFLAHHMSRASASLLVHRRHGGFRVFLGVDPLGAIDLRDRCNRSIGVDSPLRPVDTLAEHIIADLNDDRGQAVATELGGLFVHCDVTSTDDADTAVAAASEMGPLRALVNSAGLGHPGRTISRDNEPMDLTKFEFVIRVNLIGSFNVLSRAAAAMARTEPLDQDGQRGAVVNMASVAAFDGQIGQAAYSASKGGIVGMTLPIARDLAVAGIRVNTIAPGLIDTPIYGEGEQSDAFKAHLGQSVLFPMRLGSAEELAYMVMELITNPYMNGEVIRVDGGIRMPPK